MNVKLAHFELQEEIGRGGLGVVFRAFDPSLNRNVAIKVLKDDFAQNPQFVQDFLRESQNAASITHPHIAQVYFVGEYEGNYYMVMELVNGKSLEEIIQQNGPMPEQKALKAVIEVAEALKAAYAKEMIHGDIKPQNILLGEECGAKLLDFGLAQLANVETDPGEGVWGSPYYISPERVGRKAEDFRSDIYSLGATLFEMLTGRPPFDAKNPTELAMKRLNLKAPLLRTVNPNISKRTEHIVDKMLQKNALMRYVDYDALLTELRKTEAAASGQPLADTMEIQRMTGYITTQIQVASRRSQLLTIMAASAASCALAGGLFYFFVYKKTGKAFFQTEAVAASTPLSLANGSTIVKFYLRAPHVPQVQIVGNFDQWEPEQMKREPHDSSSWFIEKEVPLGIALEYQFIVDGKRIPDPMRKNSSFPDGNGTFKTIWAPASTPKPTPRKTPVPRPRKTPVPRPTAPTPPPLPTPFSEPKHTSNPKPATPGPASISTPVPVSPEARQLFEEGIKTCQRLLLEGKSGEAAATAVKLVPNTLSDNAREALIERIAAIQTEFKRRLEGDIAVTGYPSVIFKRDGTRFQGGSHKALKGSLFITTPYGEISLRINEIAPASYLAMGIYFAQKETNPNLMADRNWLTGVTVATMGLKNAGKALMEKAVAQKPQWRGDMDYILGM